MENENEELVNRALYKRIKSMNRAEMESFVRNCPLPGKIDTKKHTKVE